MNIHNTVVYSADVSALENSELYKKVYSSVSARRREKTDMLRFPKDRYLSLGAEYLLKYACRDFDVDYYNDGIIEDEFKKPRFSESSVQFNLSHSDKIAMCIMSYRSVGCDVERIRKMDMSIARRFFSDDEFKFLENLCSDEVRNKMFIKLWTLKESFMKCTGLGFSLPLKEFTINVEPQKISLRQPVDDYDYSFYEKESGGYQYACCVRDCPEEDDTGTESIIWKTADLKGTEIF